MDLKIANKDNLIRMVLLAFLSFSTIAIAAKATEDPIYKISTKIYIDGNLKASPRIFTKANHKASVAFGDSKDSSKLNIELVAHKQAADAIKINYDIKYKNANENMRSKPQITVLPKQLASVNFKTKNGHDYKIETYVENA